jgi:hypothetical protein
MLDMIEFLDNLLSFCYFFKTMERMNKIQNPTETARIMQEFEKQNMKMGMTDEMSMN